MAYKVKEEALTLSIHDKLGRVELRKATQRELKRLYNSGHQDKIIETVEDAKPKKVKAVKKDEETSE